MTAETGGWFTLRWSYEGVVMLDQRLLPREETWLEHRTAESVIDDIQRLAVRGRGVWSSSARWPSFHVPLQRSGVTGGSGSGLSQGAAGSIRYSLCS